MAGKGITIRGQTSSSFGLNKYGFVVQTIYLEEDETVEDLDLGKYELGELFRDGGTGDVYICTDIDKDGNKISE